MTQQHPTPPIRAYAITHGATYLQPALTHDQARASQIAAGLHGVIHNLYTAPALAAHIATMNTITPDPAGPLEHGAIEHLALCMSIANAAALGIIRNVGWPVSDSDGSWWIDVNPMFDAGLTDAEGIELHRQHLSVALFAGLVERHAKHQGWVRIVRATTSPAIGATA